MSKYRIAFHAGIVNPASLNGPMKQDISLIGDNETMTELVRGLVYSLPRLEARNWPGKARYLLRMYIRIFFDFVNITNKPYNHWNYNRPS